MRNLLLFIACSQEVNNKIIDEPVNSTDYTISEDEAIGTLLDFIESLPNTRSASSFAIVGCNKKNALDYGNCTEVMTRGEYEENVDITSVPVYEILTDSEEGTGFSLVLGDSRFNEVIAFSPMGSLADTVFNEGLADFISGIPALIYESLIAELEQEDLETRSYWQPEGNGAYSTDSEPISVVYYNTYEEARAAWGGYYGEWEDFRTTERIVLARWKQTSPYNKKVKLNCEGVKAKIGCAAVAMAQVMHYHSWPMTYDWFILSPQIKVSNTRGANEVSQLMIDLANALVTNISCKYDGAGGSSGSTSIYSVAPVFSQFGYTSEFIYESRDKASSIMIEEALINYGPTLTGAANHTLNGERGGGHIWITDGVYRKSRDYKTLTYGYNNYVTTYRQHFVAIHCNWGWGGSSDGWYYNFTPVNEKYEFAKYHLWSVKPNK